MSFKNHSKLQKAAEFALSPLEARRLLSAVDPLGIGAFTAAPGQAARLGGATLFCTYDRSAGQMLWITDGSIAGTHLVKDIDPAASTPATWYVSGRSNAIVLHGTYYFTAVDNAHGRELWKSNGTAAGTSIVRDLVPGADDSDPEGFTIVGDQLFFTADHQIWRTDGTAVGTQQVRGVDPLGSADAERTAVLNSELYFTIYPQTAPYFSSNNNGQLWKTNGLVGGTEFVADINGQNDFTTSIGPAFNLINVNGTLYFTANDNLHGFELWKSDGTTLGTVMVADIVPGARSSSPAELTQFGDSLFFAAAGSLWKTDGTAAGTRQISDATNPANLTVVNGSLFFTSDTGPYGRELWLTDGTPAGTHIVKDIHPQVTGSSDANPDHLLPAAGHVFFRADDGVHGLELWHSDGTRLGTNLQVDFETAGSSVAIPFGSIGVRVLATARELSTGQWHVYSVKIPIPTQPSVPILQKGSDTGVLDSDHVTSSTHPTFTGTAMPGSLVRLFDNGQEIGKMFANDGSYALTPTRALADGKHTITVTAADDEGQWSEPSAALSVRVDHDAPTVKLKDSSSGTLVLKFDENVRAALSLADVQLSNAKNGKHISRGVMNLAYDNSTNTATITFPGFTDTILPDGPYLLVIDAARVTDLAGNHLEGETNFEFSAGVSGSDPKRPLQITGTPGNDQIVVRVKADDARIFQVLFNGQTSEYSIKRYSELRIDSGNGNDSIRIDSRTGEFELPTRIYAGNGNDTIQGGIEPDRIYGGAGDDVIRGGLGNDVLYGELGRDVLIGDAGDDYLTGGVGRDSIIGGKGSDRILDDNSDHLTTDADDTVLTVGAA